MFNTIKVDPTLADSVEKEMFSIWPSWQYMRITTDYYNLAKEDSVRRDIDLINEKYGPIIDTQRFTYEIYNHGGAAYEANGIKSFLDIRNNPNAKLNKRFKNTVRLLNYIEQNHVPSNFRVRRLMINMQTIRPTWSMNAPHPDFHNKDMITVLYYVNDSDGDTFFFEGPECVNRVSPVKGTAAVYPSNMVHAGSTPTKTETRVVINMCFGP